MGQRPETSPGQTWGTPRGGGACLSLRKDAVDGIGPALRLKAKNMEFLIEITACAARSTPNGAYLARLGCVAAGRSLQERCINKCIRRTMRPCLRSFDAPLA